MRLTVRRVGGMLPTLRPTRTCELAELNEATRSAVLAFVQRARRTRRAPFPEAMSYVFELANNGEVRTVTVRFDEIPKALHALLPGPK